MKSVMSHRFSDLPNIDIARSKFDRSHGYKTTFDAGYLIPFFCDEALPGDTFSLNMTGFARLSTPIYPIMDNMRMETFFFAVPFRLVWENWQKFCGERIDPGDSIDYTIPIVNDINNVGNETIFDYFTLPTKIAATYEASCLPLRAYMMIWNEWFRDQNLQDSVDVAVDDGPDSIADFQLLKRGKRHDYFTSCLPWTQKGDDVLMSLGSEAPVISEAPHTIGVSSATGGNGILRVQNTGNAMVSITPTGTEDLTWYDSNLVADLASAESATINELREAIQLQRMLEKDARSGTRYIEIIKSHFGVNSPDFRVQRPEYLGGGSSPVLISPVAKTNDDAGQLSAIGTALLKGHGFTKSFSEHCIVIGLVNVRADLTYQEGLDRMWSRQTRYDFFWPTLAHLGEQEVLNKEIYMDATTIGDSSFEDVFGYQERFAEYRYKPSKITGKFRSNDAASLDAWHLGIEFGSQPTLDDTFIVDDPPIDRIIATPTEPHFIFDSYMNFYCTRPMPVYSIPGYIDHF